MSEAPILLVEDDPNDVLFMRRAWKQAGHRRPLQVLGNGEEAIAYLSGRAPYSDRAAHPFPALVLLDLKIPLLPGLEVLQWVRENPRLKNLPVAVLTSSEEPGDVARARALGISDYIVKPTRFEQLLEIVKGIEALIQRS